MLKKTLIMIMFILLVPDISFCDDNKSLTSDFINKQLENLNLTEIQRVIDDVNSEDDRILPKIDIKDTIKSLLNGESLLDSENIIKAIFKRIFNEVISNTKLLAQILIIAVITAILKNLQTAFASESTSKIAYFVCLIVIIVLVIKSFIITLNVGLIVINKMVTFMQAILPVLMTILVLMGGITSSAILHPIIITSVSAISSIMKDIVYPIIFFSSIIAIINNINDNFQISKVSELLRKISIWIIGITTTVFLGIMSIQGVASSKIDGVSIRTAKFALDNFIPVVGGFLSDSIDTVIGYSLILKNAIGIVGVLIILAICTIPVIKIISLILVYKLSAALIQPITDSKIVNILEEIGKSMVIVLATILLVILMFYITINIIVSAGAQTIMLR